VDERAVAAQGRRLRPGAGPARALREGPSARGTAVGPPVESLVAVAPRRHRGQRAVERVEPGSTGACRRWPSSPACCGTAPR
jgi:hypothetical protein